MSELVALIIQALREQNQRLVDIQARVDEAATVLNKDLSPVYDKQNRRHAPCDGYFWNEQVWAGGSYLPLTPTERELIGEMMGDGRSYNDYLHSITLRSTVSQYKQYMSELEAAYQETGMFLDDFKAGRVWAGTEETCNIYIKSRSEAVIKALEVFINEQNKKAEAAAKALKGDAPEGRVSIQSTIASITNPDPFDQYPSFKALYVLENGATIYGTLPAALIDCEVGAKVEFTATFTPAFGDATHAYFKRPSKVKIL